MTFGRAPHPFPLRASRGEGKRLRGLGALALVVAVAGCGEPGGEAVARRASALVWGGEQSIVADDAAELDEFGWSVALTGDSALIAAYGESGARGAAYVFARNGNGWSEAQKLVASDGVELDRFGWSVALAGDRALVGAAYAQNSQRGAAYVFVKSGGSWIEEQKLVASDGAANDQFGWSVGLDGDRAVIGAYGRDSGRGAAYVFVRGGGGVNPWTEEQKLVASDGATGDDFGYSVAIAAHQAGDRVLVGAPAQDGFRGAAYVFAWIGGAWAEEQKLVVSDGAAFDQLGNSVALAGDRALVGAYWKDDLAGAAYVFVWGGVASDPPWIPEQKLVASDRVTADRFGNSISLSADRALIGAFGSDYNRGGAYVFARNGSAWTQEQKLVASDGISPDAFAWSVSLAADRALIGANYVDQLRGAAYLYSLGVESGDGGNGADGGSADAGADAEGGQDGGPIEAGTPAPGSCTRGDDCTSGHCEDGICCDRTCSPSERCLAALKVSGEDGTCGPAKAAALGAPCKFDVQCTSGQCTDGVCASVLAVSTPAVDPGCACHTAGSPLPGPRAWPGVTLVLLFLRRKRRREGAQQ